MPLIVTEANKTTKFSSTTVVLFMELIRLCTCILITVVRLRSISKFLEEFWTTVVHNKLETAKVCVPALIYAIQNNLYYVALANIDATTYLVTHQLRIITTAVLSVALLSKRISMKQWMALVMALIGIIIVQLDRAKSQPSASKGNVVLGVSLVIAMCWTSAFAGVYFEKVLKKSSVDVWMQNIRLSMLTLPMALSAVVAKDWDNIVANNFLDGFTPMVWTVTFLNAFGGLVVAVVILYADNIRKTYCQTIAIGLTAWISIAMGDAVLTLQFMMGIILVVISILVYSLYPVEHKATAEYKPLPTMEEGDV
ncbi:unnamed protein product, partial [Mesorhabditis spiculigera]